MAFCRGVVGVPEPGEERPGEIEIVTKKCLDLWREKYIFNIRGGREGWRGRERERKGEGEREREGGRERGRERERNGGRDGWMERGKEGRKDEWTERR